MKPGMKPGMKPVLILQHLSSDGPAYLATWLSRRGVAAEVRNAEAGQGCPDSLAGYSALAILGGEMSANDPLPSLRQAEALFLEAVRCGVPTLGHCLGGQLMARALGARVWPSPEPEVGWHSITLTDGPAASDWFGPAAELTVFQWHQEAFDLPSGATHLAGSAACPHQAFAIGPHLAMQFHVELDATKLAAWCAEAGSQHELEACRHPTVQRPAQMLAEAAALLPVQQALADRLYTRWLASTQAFR